MGLYPDHGVEYHIYTRNNSKIVVASTRDTDSRLQVSNYYLSRKDQWFKYEGEYIKKIEAQDFDIKLTEKEKERFELLLKQEDVTDHGWYEVFKIQTSY